MASCICFNINESYPLAGKHWILFCVSHITQEARLSRTFLRDSDSPASTLKHCKIVLKIQRGQFNSYKNVWTSIFFFFLVYWNSSIFGSNSGHDENFKSMSRTSFKLIICPLLLIKLQSALLLALSSLAF